VTSHLQPRGRGAGISVLGEVDGDVDDPIDGGRVGADRFADRFGHAIKSAGSASS
jgi:hypothetical protein